MSLLRVIDRRYETSEIFIKADEVIKAFAGSGNVPKAIGSLLRKIKED